MANQLSALLAKGLMKKYMGDNKEGGKIEMPKAIEHHEVHILGDFNTIAKGFAGGGRTCSSRKR